MTSLQIVILLLFISMAVFTLINVIRINKITLKHRSKGVDKIWSGLEEAERTKIKSSRNNIILAIIAFVILVVIAFSVSNKNESSIPAGGLDTTGRL